MPTAPAISADTLRFVRTCHDLSRAVAQHKAALAKLPTKERHARELANPAIAEAARETEEAWRFRVVELWEASQPKAKEAPAVAAPVAQADQAQAEADRKRAMRRFYACAKAAGLNVQEVEKMKAALSKYLGRPVPSRADLREGQWYELIEAARLGLLAW